jgi:hypothetical protein
MKGNNNMAVYGEKEKKISRRAKVMKSNTTPWLWVSSIGQRCVEVDGTETVETRYLFRIDSEWKLLKAAIMMLFSKKIFIRMETESPVLLAEGYEPPQSSAVRVSLKS